VFKRKSKKRTVIISLPWELYKKGGVNSVVKGLLAQYSVADVEFNCVLHINNWQPANSSDENQPYDVIRIPTTSLSCCKGAYNKLKFLLYQMPRMYIKWYLAIKKYNVCTVNIHFPTPNTLAFIRIGKLFKLQNVYTFHGSDIDQFHEMAPECQKNAIAKFADKVVVSSSSSRERLLNKSSLYADKIRIIPNGVSIDKIKQSLVLDREDLIVAKPYFINIATYEPQKGQDILIKAYHQLCKTFENNEHKLVFVGRSTPYLDVLKKLSNDLGISKRIQFYTDLKHQEAMTLLSQAQLFILASRQEAFGIVLLEAGALGVPVMAHAVGGIVEIISPDVDGILVNENNVEEWVKKLQVFMLNESKHKDLVANFFRTINKCYGNRAVVNSYIELFYAIKNYYKV
jgi:colanic acid/amylovoran biosynthesis glycosyltransferase